MTTSQTEPAAAPLLSGIAGRRIRGLRAELGLSQSELVLQVGQVVSRSGLSDRESGVKPVPVDELPAFAYVLGVSVAYLMGFTDDRSRPLEEAASELVRHQGLEPRTRWISERHAQRGIAGTIVRLIPAPLPPTEQDRPKPAAVISLDERRPALVGVLLRLDRSEVSA